jgi:hypothetical protein
MGWTPSKYDWYPEWMPQFKKGIMGGASPHFLEQDYDDQFYWHIHSNYLPTIYKR